MDTLNKIVIVNLVLVLTVQTVFSFTHSERDPNTKSITNDNTKDNNNSYNSDDNSLSIENNLSWSCINNASCINNLAHTISSNLKNNRAINFGLMQIESLNNYDVKNRKGIKIDASSEHGRSLSSNFLHFLDGHSIKVPFGPMVINIQGSDSYDNYLEVALLKKHGSEGRRRHDKKQLQMYIPAFLAVNAVGWMMLAIAAVKVLTFKALLISKVAFVIASIMTFKKMMENSSEKQVVMPHPMEHQHEYMMPYSMEYGGSHSFHGGEMGGGSEMAFPMHHTSSGIDMSAVHGMGSMGGMGGMGSMGAESVVNSVIDMHNATQLAALQSSLAAQAKIKRNDMVWNGGDRRQSSNYNYIMSKNPFIPRQK